MKRRYQNSSPSQDPDSPVKLLFGLYQCLHHLSFLTGNANPDSRQPFSRKVEELDRFFIPALPTWNSLFKKRCHETNEKWRQEQIGNLTEHYQWCIEALTGSISAYRLTRSELLNNLNQAKKWAKQHFKGKFKIHIFDKVDQMVRNFTVSETTAKGPKPSTSSQIQAEPKVKDRSEVTSTPKRKRSHPSISETSPPPAQTPKRQKPSSYAEKTKSPTFRPNASTQKDNPAVTRFPNLKPNQRGKNITEAWKIPKITKDILILGTSNLSRISFVSRRDTQVLSYPGLKLAQMVMLLKAFAFGPKSSNPGRQPSHVILSVGINDRGLSPSTNEVELKKVIQEAKRQFPESKIGIYQQPFDQNLSSKEKSTLKEFSDTVQKQCKAQGLNCIPKIPQSKFAVVGRNDHIHWTENCANATVEHFFEHLN